jgi:hypothetical protein
MADEVWACSACRSINKPKAKSCYKCRTPRDVSGVAPSEISLGANQAPVALALPTYHSTLILAVVASTLVAAVAVLRVLSLIAVAPLLQDVASGIEITKADVESVMGLSVSSLLVPILTLVVWAFWLSRVVTVMPSLGLGYPPSTGLTAFVECLIPFYNFFRVPAILRDVTRRLAPTGSRGNALIAAAWIGLIGSFLLGFFGGWFITLTATDLRQAINSSLALEAFCAALAVVGAGFLVYLTFWIEAGIRRVRRAQTAEAAATPTVATSIAAPPSAMEPEPAATPFVPPTLAAAPVIVGAAAPEPWSPTPPTPAPGDALEPAADQPATHLRVRVDGETIEGTIDDDWEAITVGELTEAAVAIRDSGGSVTLSATDETLGTGLGRDALEAIRISGARYTVDRS